MKKPFSVIAAGICIALCLTDCTKEVSSPARPAETVIEEMIAEYGRDGKDARPQVDRLLGELDNIDTQRGAVWTDIMDYWLYADYDMPINIDKLPDDLPQDDRLCLVVLGYALNADGTMQDELVTRLETALACTKQYPNAMVACTGGCTAMMNPTASEAGEMGKWLLEHGLDKKRLILETDSLTTAQNAQFTYNILRQVYPRVDTVAIISSDYHIPWGTLMFESEFLLTAAAADVPEIHVAANCACKTPDGLHPADRMRACEAAGLLSLSGDDAAANRVYSDLRSAQTQ